MVLAPCPAGELMKWKVMWCRNEGCPPHSKLPTATAAHSFCAFLLIGNRLRQTDEMADYNGSLKSKSGKSMQDLAVEYKGWVESDRRVTRGISIVAIVVWAMMRWVVLPRWPWTIRGQALLGLIAFAALLKVAHSAVCQRTRIDEFTTSLVRAGVRRLVFPRESEGPINHKNKRTRPSGCA